LDGPSPRLSDAHHRWTGACQRIEFSWIDDILMRAQEA